MIEKYINVKWLAWMFALALFISVAYDIRTGVLWASIVSVASIYLYSLNRIISRLFFDSSELRSAKNTYDVILILCMVVLTFLISQNITLSLFLIFSGCILVAIINLISYIQSRYT